MRPVSTDPDFYRDDRKFFPDLIGENLYFL